MVLEVGLTMAGGFDVVVVGARCAGASLAADLARRGLRVCAIERSRFPSEVPSTHMVHPGGIARLRRLGLTDSLVATGAPPLDHGSFVVDGTRLEAGREVMTRFEAPWLCIRRSVLDPLLARAAEEAGAEVRTATAVEGLVQEGGTVRGVRLGDGKVVTAGLVVGADGPSSTVARLAGAGEYHVTAPGRLFLWGYFEGADAPAGYATLGRAGEIGFLAMPTDGGLYLAGVAEPMERRSACLADPDAALQHGVRRIGEVAEFLRSARRVGPVRIMARWHGYFRQASGPGWVLAGDAGHFKDPTPAQGICDALRQGEKLAGAIEAGLGGGGLGDGGIDQRLADWWRWRDDDAWEMYWFATDMGAPGRTPAIVAAMLDDLAAEPEGAERFLRMLNHEQPPSSLFTPGRLAETLLRAARRRPGRLPQLGREAGRLAAAGLRRQWVRRHSQGSKRPSNSSLASRTRP